MNEDDKTYLTGSITFSLCPTCKRPLPKDWKYAVCEECGRREYDYEADDRNYDASKGN